MKKLYSVCAHFLTIYLVPFLTFIFGSISWSSPPWMRKTHQILRSNSSKVLSCIAFMSFVIAGSFFIYFKYFSSDPVELITTKIYSPEVTPYDTQLIPQPLKVAFRSKTSESWSSKRSVAPLEMIDKPIFAGIKMVPELAGEWRWKGDADLVFFPKNDWPAGQVYHISFDKNIFANHIHLSSYRHSFSTKTFEMNVEELSLYQDPLDPIVKKIAGTINFNFPIDKNSFEKSCHLILHGIKNEAIDLSEQKYPLTITYDKHQRKAYILSSPITLPKVPRYVNLVIDKGVQAVSKTDKTKDVLKEKLLLPDTGSFLKIDDVTIDIRFNKENRLEQELIISTTTAVSKEELLKHLKVFILPKDYPATRFIPLKKDYPWRSPAQVSSEIFPLMKEIKPLPLPGDHPFPTKQTFIIKVPPSSHLFVQISKDLPGWGGVFLKGDYSTVVSVPACPQEIQFVPKGSLMALSGEKKLNVQVRGIPEVKFSVCRILDAQVNHLVSQTYGNLQNLKFLDDHFGSEAVSRISSENRCFNVENSMDLQYTTLNLNDYLANSKSKLGLFLLKAEAWDSEGNAPTGVADNRLILLTDMNLFIKDNIDHTHDIFVQSVSKGIPVPLADVMLVGRNGLPIFKGQTNSEGYLNLPSFHGFKDDLAPTFYLVRKENDLSFIPYQRADRELNYSRFDIRGINSFARELLSAFVFSDRSLYRPGENISLSFIVKNGFVENVALNMPLQVIVTDPRGSTVMNQKIALPHAGLFSLNYQLASSALTGSYDVKVYIPKNDKPDVLIGSTSVQVEEFLPDRMKMEVSFLPHLKENAGWLQPENIRVKVNMMNLFGAPGSDCKVKGKMIVSSKSLSFPQYNQYIFGGFNSEMKNFTTSLQDSMTDAFGNVEFPLNLEQSLNATYQVHFIAEGFEGLNGRGMVRENTAFVSSWPYLIGYKAPESLNFKRQEKASIQLIAINPSLQSIAMGNIFIELSELKRITALVKKPNGTYCYQTEPQEVNLSKQPYFIEKGGSTLDLPTGTDGEFVLTIKDEKNHELNKFRFSVGINTQNPFSDANKLEIQLSKKEYEPGEKIEMQITAPFPGAGLITIERDKVYAYQWFKADPSSNQTISLPPDFQGNGYINVAFIRDWDFHETYMNPLSYAVVPFNVSRKQQMLQVNLNVPTFVRAGEDLPIQISTEHPAKMILIVVDEGILQLADHQTPDPLAYFFRKQALGVKTSQIGDLILPKFKEALNQSSTGGDNRRKLLSMSQNPFKSHTEKAVAFCSGIIDTDSQSKTIFYQVPDYFNGNLRIMAIASSSNKVGSIAKNTQVQACFAIQSHVPTFVSPGDVFTITADITNCLKNEDVGTPVSIDLEAASAFEILGSSKQVLAISPGDKQSVIFQIKTNQHLGEFYLKWKVTQGDKTSAVKNLITVRPAVAYRTHLVNGYSKASKITIPLTRQLYSEHQKIDAIASHNPLILVDGLKAYLSACPYSSTKSLIAKAFSQLCDEKTHDEFEKTIQMLRERQTHNGGFANFSGNDDAKIETSLYVFDYLICAKEEGYHVPADFFSTGIQFLENIAKKYPKSLSEARNKAYAIYLLTRMELVTTNYLTDLHLYLTENHRELWKKDLICSYIAASYQLLKSTKEAKQLIDNYPFQNLSETDNAIHVILLAKHFPDHLHKMNEKPIECLLKEICGKQLNMSSASDTVRALHAHAKMMPALAPAQLPISKEKNDKEICIHNKDEKTCFYQIQESGFDQIIPMQSIKNGLEIVREYTDEKGLKIDKVDQGQIIEVKIQSRTLTSEPSDYSVIVDLLPGGFEIVRESIKSKSCHYVEAREDRVIWYCSLSPSAIDLRYRLQAVNKGTYAVPPIFAQDLHNEKIQAQNVTERIEVR